MSAGLGVKPLKRKEKGVKGGLEKTTAGDVPAPGDYGSPEYKAKNDFQDLMRAEEIKQDPDRMDAVHKHAKGQSKAIKSVQDIVAYRNKKYGPGAENAGDDDGSDSE